MTQAAGRLTETAATGHSPVDDVGFSRASSGPGRVLVCGPVFAAGTIGGLPLALEDLAASLRARGWEVDLAVSPQSLGVDERADAPGLLPAWNRRPSPWVGSARRLPSGVRTLLQHLLLGGGVARAQSDAMYALERRLTERSYRAVIALVSRESPGMACFVTQRHPHVLLLSLNGLAAERRAAAWLWAPRVVARIARLHPDSYRPVPVDRIRSVVFGSDAWKDEAVAAGVASDAARVIHFGMAAPEPLESLRPVSGRLLFVGRCSPEKGLHLFLDALALVRSVRPVTLTAVCGPGPTAYRAAIERQVVRLGLQDVVALRPPVARRDLPALYRAHDLLLFQSAFAEPVALVVMEAFAAGLPVVAPVPKRHSVLIAPDRTSICYRASTPADVASAIERALADEALRDRIRTAAHALVVSTFSLEAMGHAYDCALRELTMATECGSGAMA